MRNSLISLACISALVGCGGGGDDTPSTTGTYQAYTADGRNFPLTLDFTQLTYAYTVDGVARSGTLTKPGGQVFSMQNPTGQTGALASITVADNVTAGSIRIGADLVPFVAAKSFVSTLADVGGKYLAVARDTTVSSGAGASAARWYSYRIDAAAATATYCSGVATGTVAGNNPLLDADNCLPGTTTVSGSITTGTTPGTFIQVAADTISEVRFAKSGDSIYYFSAPVSSDLSKRSFIFGVAGAATDYRGQWVSGANTAGAGVSVTFADATSVAFAGGTVAAPGSAAASGTVAKVADNDNALRFTPTGASVPVGGFVVGGTVGVYGNFTNASGDLTLFAR